MSKITYSEIINRTSNGSDNDMEGALDEYVETRSGLEKADLVILLSDQEHRRRMISAINHCAMLFAVARSVIDEAEFSSIRKRIMMERRFDDESIEKMTVFFLSNVDCVIEGNELALQRIEGFKNDYLLMRGR